MIQTPLFENEKEEGTITQKILKGPGPMAKKLVGNLHIYVQEIPFRREVDRIFNSTKNRIYLQDYNWREVQDISVALVRVSKKIGGPIDIIINRIINLLIIKTSLYTTQAIEIIYGMKKQ